MIVRECQSMEKNRISVMIDGNTYNVISDDDEMHVLTVAEMVDHQIRDIKKKANSLTPSMVSVLSAMNIADEFIKFKDIINDSKRVQTRNNALELMEKQIKNLRNELQNSQGLLEKSNEKVFFLQRKLTDKEEELQSLENKQQNFLENKSIELENSLKTLKEANLKVGFLQRKLAEKEKNIQDLQSEQQNSFENNNIELENRLKALENETNSKQAIIDEANEKILYLQRKLNNKEDDIQSLKNEQQNFFESTDNESEDRLRTLENEIDVNQVLIGEANEKVFYLQRKLTDKEEELQNVRQEFEQFLEEFEK